MSVNDGGEDITDTLTWGNLEFYTCSMSPSREEPGDLSDALGASCFFDKLLGHPAEVYEPQGDEFLLHSPRGDARPLPVYVSDACFSPLLARERGAPRRAVILCHDARGFSHEPGASRLRELADAVARDLGAVAVAPDFFRGEGWNERDQGPAYHDADARRAWFARVSDPDAIGRDLDEIVVPFLHNDRGVRGGDVAALGFSWGGAVCFVAGRYAWCCCGAAAHSTLSCFSLRGSSPTEAAALVKCPQMLLQSGADPDATKRGSALQDALPGASVLDDYPAMKHGFLLRGDRDDPAVARDARDATARLLAFVEQHQGV